MTVHYELALTVDGWHLYRCGACHGLVMGEAAATAVHLALADDVDPTGVDVRQLQRTLSKNGVFLGMETA